MRIFREHLMDRFIRRPIAAAVFCAGLLLLAAVPAAGIFSASAEALPQIVISADDPLSAAESLKGRYGIENVRDTLEFHRALPVAYGTVYRFCRKGETKDVLILSADKDGRLLSVNYSPAEAGDQAAAPQKSEGITVDSVQTDGLGNEIELPIDLTDGVYSLSDGLRNIYTYDMNGGVSATTRRLYRSNTETFSDELAVSAYASILKAYDFYADADNIGVSFLGVDDNNDKIAGNAIARNEISVYILMHYSQNYMNANYLYSDLDHAALLCIGDGGIGGTLYHQARATDVLAHEYQHAITDFTAGLDYLNESGALNEAFSDIFGALIEGHDPCEKEFWETGENAVAEGQDALRSAIFPNSTTRFNYQHKFPLCHRLHSHTDCDSGGVHYNSGILTHMQYTLWRNAPAFFTRQRIGTLWFTTLLNLTSNATFEEFAREFRSAAGRLGYPDNILALIDDCLFASGITAKENFHIVTFLNADGTLLDEVCVRNGTAPILPVTPERESNPIHDFVFTGWSRDLSAISEDVTVIAQYKTQPRTYPVCFLDENGQILKEENVPYGEGATPPPAPEKSPEGRIDYLFDGWVGGNYLEVRQDTVLTPSYRAVPCYYVTFLDSGGLPYRTVRVREGERPHEIEPPPKADTPETEFIFLGWDGDLSSVTEDLTVRPLYEEQPRRYTIFFTADGKLLFTQECPYGTQPAFPDPQKKGFSGWYLDETCTLPADGLTVTGDITLYAGRSGGCNALAPLASLFPLLALPLLCCPRKKIKRG